MAMKRPATSQLGARSIAKKQLAAYRQDDGRVPAGDSSFYLTVCHAMTGDEWAKVFVRTSDTLLDLKLAIRTARALPASVGLKVLLEGSDLSGDSRTITELGLTDRSNLSVIQMKRQLLLTSDEVESHVWDASTGVLLMTLSGHTGRILSCTFSSDGEFVATGSADHTARIWDTQTGCCRAVLHARDVELGIKYLAFSPVNTLLVTVASLESVVRIWDVATGQLQSTLGNATSGLRRNSANTIHSAKFSSDGSLLIVASSDKKARIWRVHSGSCCATLVGHKNSVRHACFSPDDLLAVTASDDKTARLWNVQSGDCQFVMDGHLDGVRCVDFSPCGSKVLTRGYLDVRIWDVVRRRHLMTLRATAAGVGSAMFSPDGSSVLTGATDRCAKVWHTSQGSCALTFEPHEGKTGESVLASFSGDGTLIATVSTSRTAKVFDASTGGLLHVLKHRRQTSFAAFL